MNDLADFLTDITIFDFFIISPYEWCGHDVPRRVPMENMGVILDGIKDEPDTHAKLAHFPPHFFVWSNDLTNGFNITCERVKYDRETEPCPFSLDWNPSIHPYEDLIAECPDFSPPPSGREQRRQTTAARDVTLRERAAAIRSRHPGKSEIWVAREMVRLEVAEGLEEETVRKKIRKQTSTK